MKFFLFALILSLGSSVMACEVYNYKDAIECVKIDALERYDEGELPHSVGATKTEDGKIAFQKITGIYSEYDYIAVVEVHYDEDQLLYYQINKGQSVEPVFVDEFNLVDISYDVPELSSMTEEEALKVLSLEIPLVESMEDFHL